MASNEPVAYLITIRTYGSWLHGDHRGSVDRHHNAYGTPQAPPRPSRLHDAKARTQHATVSLDEQQRQMVVQIVDSVCAYKQWTLHEINVRTTHMHVVVSAPAAVEQVMQTLKAWITRRLREAHLVKPETRIWSRHGSTRYLWNERQLRSACSYVLDAQGPDLHNWSPD